MAGFEPATHHYFVGHCTVYPAAGPLAPQGDSLKNNPLAQIQLPFGDRKHSCLQPHLYKTALRAALYRINRFGLTLSLRQPFSAALPAQPNPFGYSSPVRYLYRQNGFPRPHRPFSSSLEPHPAPPDPGSPARR